jgi:signal transduction histidine kinase
MTEAPHSEKASPRTKWLRPSGLFGKYAVYFIGFAIFILLVNHGLEMWVTYRDTRTTLLRAQFEKAEAAAQRVEQFISELERQISWATRASAATPEQRRSDYALLLQQTPAIAELYQLDGVGREQLRVSRSTIRVAGGADFSRDPRFIEGSANRIWFSPIFFAGGANPFMSIAIAHSGRDTGVTVADVDLRFLSDIVGSIQAGKNGYAYIVDSQGRLIAHSVASKMARDVNLAKLPQVASLQPTFAQPGTIGEDLEGRAVLTASAPIFRMTWAAFLEQPLSEAYGPVYDSLFRLLWLLAIGLVLAVIAGTLLARRMAVPIRRVGIGASRIGAGDFEHKIDVRTGDEIQTLAEEFNRMSTQLRESYSRLEQKVEERTRDLAQSVRELTALEEVGRAVTSSLDLKDVLSTVVSRAVDLTGADAGAVYSYDSTERVFTLMEPRGYDQPLVEAVGTISVDDNEQVLQAAIESETPILIEDIATSQPFRARDAMLRAGFTSVLLVPLRSADEFFGFLVVHWRAAGGVRPRTIELMQTFAHQSVLAIHNAELFQEIEEKGRQLAIASEHKSQFFANMSHELRTPLNAVLGYAELLIDNLYGEIPDKAKEILGRVQSNGKHLLGLINDVLDLSKIEAGQLTLALEDYSVRAVVDSVVDTTEALAGAKGLALVTDIPEDLPIGRGDERRLMQALLNIVSNAIKFTESGSIRIRVRTIDGFFALAVTDSGPGISTEDQARIFEAFQQVDNSNTRQQGGTGLGLSIARRLVALHGGMIELQSELGIGSTFTIVLPIRVNEQKEAA